MYLESIKSKFKIIGYTLMALSFIYFSLASVFGHLMPELIYNNLTANRILPYFHFVFCLVLLLGASLINAITAEKRSLIVALSTLLLGLPYPIQGVYILIHSYRQPNFLFYDLFAVVILSALTYSLIQERKLYKFVGIILLVEWFFFDYWIALSGQYTLLGLSGMLTDMVSVLMVIYCILEIIMEKTFSKLAL